ncbi:MAG: response regulator [Methylacidiphilales bacterium]|nr:response regulator [Candidatus Methylacidiphilales bacterium]NJR14495.1 response regulator [Calothrix sp. CSU_2_0]
MQNQILIVDDNPTNTKVLFNCLKSAGYRILIAQSGESALEKLEIASPDLILLDVMMPGINGFETCQCLKSSPVTQNIPVIFMTALSDTEEKLQGFSVGAVDYITKPFHQEEVLARVSTHLQLRNLTKELQVLNQELEQRVIERTSELTKALEKLQKSQLQLIQGEKMSSLGNLIAGVAHEINNPISFISGNVNQTKLAVKDIVDCLRLYQEELFNPSEKIQTKIAEVDLEYLIEDLPKMIDSMEIGCDRIREISTSLRTFSRSDTSNTVLANIHEGIDSTLMILQHRLKADETRPAIQVVKDYGDIPKIECYLGQLNQVFMNIIANAIDSFDDINKKRKYLEIELSPNIITITTEIILDQEQQKVKLLIIKIQDNGSGMSENIKNRVFDHLYTTKNIGQGTGLGLSISKQIIEDKHQGKIKVESELGKGSKFIIILPISLSIN